MPWIAAALKFASLGKLMALLAVVSATAFLITSTRLENARAALTEARAGLIDPTLHRPWRELAIERQARLTAANDNSRALSNALAQESASAAAASKAGTDATALANRALATAHRAADAASINAATILQARPGASHCESAFLLIKGARK